MKYQLIIILISAALMVSRGVSTAETESPAEKEAKSGIESIRVLDLKTAGLLALGDNPSVAAAQERVAQAKEQLKQAKAAYWPTLDLKGAASHVDMSDSDYNENIAMAKAINPAASIDNPDTYYQAGLEATWLMFDGFDRKFANAAARYGIEVTVSGDRDVKRLLLSSVADAYFTAQLSRENIEIAKADKAFYSRQLEEANARLTAGTGSLSDKLNFEVRVNAANADLIRAERTYEASMYGLAALLGIDSARFPESLELTELKDESEEEFTPVNHNEWINYAMNHRPDIHMKEREIELADSSVKRAKARFYPSLYLAASYSGDRTGDAGFEGDDFGNTISLNLSYNLFSGGAHRAKVSEAAAKKREAEKSTDNIKLTVRSDVRRSVAGLESARRQLVLQRSNAQLVKQNRDLVETEYSAGQSSLVRLNEAQRDLTTARSRLVLALVSMRQARYRLATDTGQILELFGL